MVERIYRTTCDRCGAVADITDRSLYEGEHAGWVGVTGSGEVGPGVIAGSWDVVATLCPDCHSTYESYQRAVEDAKAKADAWLGKVDLSGEGSEENPYEFAAGITCVVNAYYRHDGTLYVYMPADAEPHAYDSWEAAEADFALWATEAGSEEA